MKGSLFLPLLRNLIGLRVNSLLTILGLLGVFFSSGNELDASFTGEQKVNVNIRTYGWPASNLTPIDSREPYDGETLYLFDGDTEFPIFIEHISKQFEYRGLPQFDLYRGKGEERGAPVAQVRIPLDAKDVMIVFLPISKKGGGVASFKNVVIPEEPLAQKTGVLQLLNLSSSPLLAKIQDTKFSLNPRKNYVYEFDESGRYRFTFYVLKESSTSEWIPEIATRLKMSPDDNYYIFIAPRKRGGEERLVWHKVVVPHG